MSCEIRRATAADADAIATLSADVQGIHAAALPWRFKQPGPDTFTPADAAARKRDTLSLAETPPDVAESSRNDADAEQTFRLPRKG